MYRVSEASYHLFYDDYLPLVVLVPTVWQADDRSARGRLITQNASAPWKGGSSEPAVSPVMLLRSPVPHTAKGPLPSC